ncbi:hypothetical protein [Terriglobus sp.]|uniref:hypothetical protein n=1 Tax=Terriglobus sp. TaxID=1889013 RepID=UPI003AFF98AF
MMIWREVTAEDLSECLQIASRHVGDELVGRSAALQIWRTLAQSPMFRSAVLECTGPGKVPRICGFGSSVFVSSRFADRELADPKPFLNSRVIASIAENTSVVLSQKGLSTCNEGAGLDVIIFGGVWLSEGLTSEQVRQAQMLLPAGFAETHVGYKLNRIFSEAIGQVQRNYLTSSGVWRVVKDLAGTDRSLFLLNSESAFSVSGSVAALLFQYEAPILDLRDADKHLLSETLQGGTDAEIARRMNLALVSVKKRWQSLFERITEDQPGLLHDSECRLSEGTRGPQKRHHILAYVRSHPQELRPYKCPR